MGKKYETNTTLEDGIALRNAQLSAMQEIHRISNSIKEGKDYGYVDILIAGLRTIDIYRTKRYPDEEAPAIIYNFVLERAKELLPQSICELLEEYGKIR